MKRSNIIRNRIAVFFQTTQMTPAIVERYRRITQDVAGFADCFLAVQAPLENEELVGFQEATYLFDKAKLPSQLGYSFLFQGNIVPGSAHYPLVLFSKSYAYDYYWFIEYDVEFSGNWRDIIELPLREKLDFASSHVRKYSDDPDWYWWYSFKLPYFCGANQCDFKYLWSSFNPIYCVSRKALKWINLCHKLGFKGHNEVLLVNLIRMRFWRIVDFAAHGYVKGTGREPHCPPETLSTMRWRPNITAVEYCQKRLPNMLYHPVKDDFPSGCQTEQTT